jgi:hypothetical protein
LFVHKRVRSRSKEEEDDEKERGEITDLPRGTGRRVGETSSGGPVHTDVGSDGDLTEGLLRAVDGSLKEVVVADGLSLGGEEGGTCSWIIIIITWSDLNQKDKKMKKKRGSDTD